MAKYLITEVNLPLDINYTNIINFETEGQRDSWVQNNLFTSSDKWQDLLETRNNNGIKKITPLQYTINNIELGADPYNKNCIIIKYGKQLDFCFINSIINSGNANTYNLSVSVILWLTRVNYVNTLKNLKIIKGHTNTENYLNETFDTGNKEVIKTERIKLDESTGYKNTSACFFTGEEENQTSWLYVIEKVKSSNLQDRLIKRKRISSDSGTYNGFPEPFKVYVEPIKNIVVGWVDSNTPNYWPGWGNLADYIANPDKTANIIAVFKSAYCPIIGNTLSDPTVVWGEANSGWYNWTGAGTAERMPDNIHFDLPLGDDSMATLAYIDYDLNLVNQYKINLDINNISKLDGLLNYEIQHENNFNYKININFIQPNGDLVFKHTASITTEWEERLKFLSPKFLIFVDEDNIYPNQKQFNIATNEYAAYKSNNPVSSFLNPIKDITKTITGSMKGLIFAGSKGIGLGAVLGGFGAVNNIIGRQDMKRKPSSLTMSGDALGDTLLNQLGDAWVLNTLEPIGYRQKAMLTEIYRDGIEYSPVNYADKFEDIKRPYFNYLVIGNLFEANTVQMSNEELNQWNAVFSNGVRIWNNPDYLFDYEVDNGD